jgi:hypothetical protein
MAPRAAAATPQTPIGAPMIAPECEVVLTPLVDSGPALWVGVDLGGGGGGATWSEPRTGDHAFAAIEEALTFEAPLRTVG